MPFDEGRTPADRRAVKVVRECVSKADTCAVAFAGEEIGTSVDSEHVDVGLKVTRIWSVGRKVGALRTREVMMLLTKMLLRAQGVL